MSITPDQIKAIRTEFARLKPARVRLGRRQQGKTPPPRQRTGHSSNAVRFFW